MTTCRKIVNWRTYLRFPPEAEAALTPAARDFITRLLSDVEERLGSHGGATEIRAHPFFAGVDWARLYDARPPYRPALEHELDTQVWWGWVVVGGAHVGGDGEEGLTQLWCAASSSSDTSQLASDVLRGGAGVLPLSR
jgi:serine/threonine kinase 38